MALGGWVCAGLVASPSLPFLMQKKWNTINFVGLGLVLLFAAIFYPRYLAGTAGVPSKYGDYASHVNIEEHLRKGILFPAKIGVDVGGVNDAHSISSSLPIYHGILGFHVLAFFVESMGIPLPGAYGLLMDLSLLIVLFAGIHELSRAMVPTSSKVAAASVLALVILPGFIRAIDFSFFPQVLSSALLILSYKLWQEGQRQVLNVALSMACLAFAIFCYPDFLLWLLPVFIFYSGRRYFYLPAVLMSLVWACFMFVMFRRLHLGGSVADGLVPFVFLAIGAGLFGREMWQKDRALFLLFVSFLAVATVLLGFSYRFGAFSYYAQKALFPAGVFLFYLILKSADFKKLSNRIFAICLMVAILYVNRWVPEAYLNFILPPVAYNNSMYLQHRASERFGQLRKDSAFCRDQGLLILQDEMDNKSEFADLRKMMRASLEPSFEITDRNFIDPRLHALFQEGPNTESFTNFMKINSSLDVIQSLNHRIARAEALGIKIEFCLAGPVELSGEAKAISGTSRVFTGNPTEFFYGRVSELWR